MNDIQYCSFYGETMLTTACSINVGVAIKLWDSREINPKELASFMPTINHNIERLSNVRYKPDYNNERLIVKYTLQNEKEYDYNYLVLLNKKLEMISNIVKSNVKFNISLLYPSRHDIVTLSRKLEIIVPTLKRLPEDTIKRISKFLI